MFPNPKENGSAEGKWLAIIALLTYEPLQVGEEVKERDSLLMIIPLSALLDVLAC